MLRPSIRDSSVIRLYTLTPRSSKVHTNDKKRDINGLTIKKENNVDPRIRLAKEVPVENSRKSKNLSANTKERAIPCSGLRTRSLEIVYSWSGVAFDFTNWP